MAGGAGPLWLVLGGLRRHSWLVVWGPHCRSAVVVCWAFVAVEPLFAIHGAGHSLFFVGGGAGCLSHCSWMVVVALVVLFVGGGGGVPSSVFVRRGAWSSSLVIRGWSFVFVDAPSVVIPCWHRVVILNRFHVLSSCVLTMLLSPALLVIVPCRCCCHALIVMCCCNDGAQRPMSLFIIWLPCHCQRHGTWILC